MDVQNVQTKEKVAAAYTKGRYFLGMQSNQRSESLNSRVHNQLDRKMSLVDVVEHTEHCISRMRRNEAELDAICSQSVPFTRIDACLLEINAARIYKPKKFQDGKRLYPEIMCMGDSRANNSK